MANYTHTQYTMIIVLDHVNSEAMHKEAEEAIDMIQKYINSLSASSPALHIRANLKAATTT